MTSIVTLSSRSRVAAALVLTCLASAVGCIQLPKPDFEAMWEKVPTPKHVAAAEKQKFTLARLAERRGQPAEAKHVYEAILAKNANHQQSHHRLAVYYAQQHKFPEADAHFHKAWELGPQTADLLSDMGYRLHLEHRLPEAEKLLRDALAIEPQHAAATNNLAIVVGQQDRLQEAFALFKQVGGEAEAEANIAYLLAQRGDLRLAQAHYSKALTLKGDLKPAAAALLQIADRESLHVKGQPLLEPLQAPARYAAPRTNAGAEALAGGANGQSPNMASGDGQPMQPGASVPPALATNPYNLPLPERALAPAGSPPGIPAPGVPGPSPSNQAMLTGYNAPPQGTYGGQQIAPTNYQAAPGGPVSPMPFGTQGTPPAYQPSNPGAARITGVQPLGW